MTPETEKKLLDLIENPPPGSAIAAAREFGVDLYSIVENLKLTPAERFERGEANRWFAQRLRKAARKAGL